MASQVQGNVYDAQTPRLIVLESCIYITFLGAILLTIWLVTKPAKIAYTVEDGSIHGFNLTNNTLNATFDLSLRANNPNSRIAIYYDSINASVWFDHQMIAFGDVPPFFQPRSNVTRLEVEAHARSMLLPGSVARDLKHLTISRGVEVEVQVNARLRYKTGRWKFKKYNLRAYCWPVVLYLDSSKLFNRTNCHVFPIKL